MQMRAEAQDYCQLIESATSFGRETFAAELAVALARLLTAASELPRVTPSDQELAQRPTDEDWKATYGSVQQALGEWDAYWTTLDPVRGEGDAVMLPVADDLADIWRDLKNGLDALEAGAAEADVVWEWRFSFYSHWGRHATEALRALHARLAEDGGPSGTQP